MLRDELAPRLRGLGFKGSGHAFSIPDDAHWISLGFQKSQFSDGEALRFTVNVTVANKAVWARMRQERTYLPAKPAPNTLYGDYAWSRRIGQLLPGGQDQWWELRADSPDSRTVAALVAAAVHDYVMPAITAQLEGEA